MVPGGNSPWCCCHLSACPSKAMSLDGGTTLTTPARAGGGGGEEGGGK